MKVNKSFSSVFFIHLSISNKAYIPNLILLSNDYNFSDKHQLNSIFFQNTCGRIRFMIHLCLNYCTIGQLLNIVNNYVLSTQFDLITLEIVNEIYYNLDNCDNLKSKFQHLDSTQKQVLKLIISNFKANNTLFLLNAQIYQIRSKVQLPYNVEVKCNILPILQSLTRDGYIVCSNSKNCEHLSRINLKDHCSCTDHHKNSVNCKVCVFSIADNYSYNLHLFLENFQIDSIY